MIHWSCDRCKNLVEGEPMTLGVSPNLATLEQPSVLHFCGPCKESFVSWFTAVQPVKPEPETKPEPKPETKGATDGGD